MKFFERDGDPTLVQWLFLLALLAACVAADGGLGLLGGPVQAAVGLVSGAGVVRLLGRYIRAQRLRAWLGEHEVALYAGGARYRGSWLTPSAPLRRFRVCLTLGAVSLELRGSPRLASTGDGSSLSPDARIRSRSASSVSRGLSVGCETLSLHSYMAELRAGGRRAASRTVRV